MEKAESSDATLKFEFIIVWNKSPFDKVKAQETFDHYIKMLNNMECKIHFDFRGIWR